jgi:hypothetical protein
VISVTFGLEQLGELGRGLNIQFTLSSSRGTMAHRLLDWNLKVEGGCVIYYLLFNSCKVMAKVRTNIRLGNSVLDNAANVEMNRPIDFSSVLVTFY